MGNFDGMKRRDKSGQQSGIGGWRLGWGGIGSREEGIVTGSDRHRFDNCRLLNSSRLLHEDLIPSRAKNLLTLCHWRPC